MALDKKDLASYSGSDIFADYEQVSMHERIVAVFAVAGSATTLKRCSPVAFNTSTKFYVPWASGGANGTGTIVGFVWPDEVVLDTTNAVQAVIFAGGRIAYSDIAATVASGSITALKTELQNNALSRGIIVEGLEDIH